MNMTRERIKAALERCTPHRRRLIEKRAADTPKAVRTAYLRAALGLSPARARVKAHCLECVGWVRADVTACTSLACALYQLRPYQKATTARMLQKGT